MDLSAWRIAMPPDSSSDDTATSTSMEKPKKSVRYFNTYLSLLLYQFFILVDWCLHFNLGTCRLRIWKLGQWIGGSSSKKLVDPSHFNRHILPRHPSQFSSSTNRQRLQQRWRQLGDYWLSQFRQFLRHSFRYHAHHSTEQDDASL